MAVNGGLSAAGPKPLALLPGSDLWYRTERLPSDARFAYEFRVTRAVRLSAAGHKREDVPVLSTGPDPLNGNQVDGKSAAELPRAPAWSWGTPVAERPSGEIERQALNSALLDERRAVSVYTPPGYESLDAPCPAALLLDGGDYESRRTTGVVLDNLLAEKKIPPLVVVMIHSEGSRTLDLEFSPEFAQFVGEELVPWLRENYRLSKDPGDTIMGGNQIGGALAAYCGLRYPRLFGKVLVQCGAFWVRPVSSDEPRELRAAESSWIARQYAEAPRQKVRIHLEVGSLAAPRVVAANQHLRDVLQAKGYPHTYAEFSGNHSSQTWHASLVRGLMALWAR